MITSNLKHIKLFEEYSYNRMKLQHNAIIWLEDYIDWVKLPFDYALSNDFIKKYSNRFQWYILSTIKYSNNPKSVERFFRYYHNYIDWPAISQYHKLTENFIRDYYYALNWHNISKFQNLSSNIIREFQDLVYWNLISKYQNLSEDLIIEFQNRVDWFQISQYQTLSEDFILKFKDKLNIHLVIVFQNISPELKAKLNWPDDIYSAED